MAVSISISITQNSQNIANNTSNVTVSVKASWTYGSWNAGSPSGTLTIDGTAYGFSSSFNTGQSTTGSQTLYTKTVNVSHKSDGSKTLSCSASFATGVSSGTVTASASKVLTTIPRKSTLTVADGTLGTAQTLTISEKASVFYHKLTYTCGDSSGYILGSSSATSGSLSTDWTPPLSLANENTTGTSVSVTFKLSTYTSSSGSLIGTNEYTKTFSIPSSVKPIASFTVVDANGYSSTYGKYIQGKSKLDIDITASGSYGSTIKSYSTTVDGKSYTKASITSSVISGSGILTITVKVTDSRGRSVTTTKDITVLEYNPPILKSVTAKRTDVNGNSTSNGGYLTVTFSGDISPLDNKNTAQYMIKYKKLSEDTYTTVELTDYSGTYTVTDITYTFEAITSSSYNIQVIATDAFEPIDKNIVGSSIKKLWSILSKGLGFAFGKIAEIEGVLDIGFKTKFSGGLVQESIPDGTDLNDVTTLNTYSSVASGAAGYLNCPISYGTFILHVYESGNQGQLSQFIRSTSKTKPESWERHYYQNSWGEWLNTYDQLRTELRNELTVKDTGWITATLSSSFKVYNNNTNVAPRYRRIGNIVYLTGSVSPTSNITINVANTPTILTLPEGFRPCQSWISQLCQGSETAVWTLYCMDTGVIRAERYRNGTTYTTVTTSNWMPFNISFITNDDFPDN